MSIQSVEEVIKEADGMIQAEDFSGAVQELTTAIEMDCDDATVFVKRSLCQQRLGNSAAALEDANKALELQPDSKEALFRKGVALFGQDEFVEAQSCFESCGGDFPGVRMWLRKCNAELAEIAAQQEKEEEPPSEPAAPPVPSVRHEWYQSDDCVYVSLFARNRTRDDIDVSFEPREITVVIKLSSGEEARFHTHLWGQVDEARAEFTVTRFKVELTLPKAAPVEWTDLAPLGTPEAPYADAPPASSTDPLSYPSSARHRGDWTAVERAVEAEEKEEKPEGDEALMKLFKDIYGKADEATRRAMVKSFTESGGTVLSTNWAEVGKGEVKGEPPKGMEFHTWDK